MLPEALQHKTDAVPHQEWRLTINASRADSVWQLTIDKIYRPFLIAPPQRSMLSVIALRKASNSRRSLAYLQARSMGTAARQSHGRNAGLPYKQRLQRSSQQQGMYLIALVVGMVGLTYASVPLYR